MLPPSRQLVFVDDLEEPELTDGDVHHLHKSLRLRTGEVVLASDGRGAWRRCVVAAGPEDAGDGPTPRSQGRSGRPGRSDGRRAAGLRLLPQGPVQVEPEASTLLTVAFVLPKGDRPAWVVQKLTELGVDRIVPLTSARSVVRWTGDRAAMQVERLRAVAREAAMQSRRPRLPVVAEVRRFADFAADVAGTAALCQPGGPPPDLGHPCLVVGPEGGWEAEELAAVDVTVGLAPTVLRSETAAVAAGVLLGALRAGLVLPSARPGPASPS